jgi:hypothetical protein
MLAVVHSCDIRPAEYAHEEIEELMDREKMMVATAY